jgi:hypothetical protein
MLRAIAAFALSSANLATTSLVPAFLAVMNSVKAKLGTVETLRASVAQSVTGYAAQKKALKTTLVDLTNTIMKAAYAYAVANNDQVLAAKMKTSRSALKDKKYIDLIALAQGVHSIVSPLAILLADYGVTSAILTLWQTTTANLEKIISNPKNAIANRTAVNKDIQNTLRQSMNLVTEQADALAPVFITLNKQLYYNAYIANRKLNPHRLSTQLRAHIVDELNQPIPGATVAIDGTTLSGTADMHGYCLLPEIPFGEHIVTITTGSVTRTFGPFRFKKGKSLTKYFTTAPALQIVDIPVAVQEIK